LQKGTGGLGACLYSSSLGGKGHKRYFDECDDYKPDEPTKGKE